MKKFNKKNKKTGMEPGSIIYTGNRKNDDINIELITYNESGYSREKIQNIEKINFRKDRVNWLNIDGVHDVDMIKKIGEKFNIDSLILEDITNVHQRAKLEEREDFLYIVLKMFKDVKGTAFEQVSLIITEDYLITFQEDVGDVFDNIRKRIEDGLGKVRKKKADYLAYLILDAIVDNYFIILEKTEFDIDELEERLINKSRSGDLRMIVDLRQEFVLLKRAIIPVRDLSSRMSHTRELNVFKDDMSNYLNDLHDHVIVIHEIMENLSARVIGLVEIYHSTINSVMNETMRFLTIVSTIFVPLTFLAGVYGMNFQHMPELSWKFGYFALLGIMFITACGMVYLFKKKKWF